MVRQQKTVTLSPDTAHIAGKIAQRYHSGFSGWLRAMIRQWDEDHDPIKTSIYLDSILRALKNHDNLTQVMGEAAELRKQASLEAFE